MTESASAAANRFEEWDAARVREIAASLSGLDGPCLPVLHAVQDTFGYIDPEAIPIVADVLNLSRAEVVGIVSFYHDFRESPPGEHILRVCRAESCQSMGAEQLVRDLTGALNLEQGTTSADGRLTFDSVYCLGNCALSPAAMLDGRLLGRVTPQRIEALVSRPTA